MIIGTKRKFFWCSNRLPSKRWEIRMAVDIQVFVNTACYNMDSYIFYKKFMNDLWGEEIMYFNGDIPCFASSLK